ncbi:oxidoreductase [Actinophytocola algeriensis]|uniref:Aryl-alcohol dehydrogenase-like predicted oxidoreductase n=1 Tax=Actinophytocola algeriensis TaxID=1768010 RepID=A0A7W7QE15_9PSEU|nr:oxidoreductase [Actinophytocola algeriensis]MBB4911808.1 aryl-alcohol dehydrogenase-like predicted oxidoreductase [Actinophytocola algeriensis]MBE1477700.1 aryl-alcohol dehydrogenase-like predicted oxidoreductase [Actinophytocola algeriensis]
MTSINANAAGTWQLGDRTVNRMGFGAMRLPMTSDGGPRDREQSIAVLRRAVELGVNHIDTAAFYFLGGLSSNELIHSALAPYPDDLVITTKVGPGRDEAGNFLHVSDKDALRGQVEQNLRELGLDHLEVVNFRIGQSLERGEGSLAEGFGALAELQQEGLIRHLGISNVDAGHLKEAMDIAEVVCVQNQYGLTTRREDDALLDLCAEHGVAFVPFFAIAAGGEQQVVSELAQAHGVSEAQVRLAWTLHKGPHVLAIPGTGDPAHLEENIAAAGVRLTEDELTRLDTIG